MITLRRQTTDNIRRFKHESLGARCLAAGKSCGEQTWELTRDRGRGQEPREHRLMRRIGETARRVARFPATAWQYALEIGSSTLAVQFAGNVITQCIEGKHQNVVGSDEITC